MTRNKKAHTCMHPSKLSINAIEHTPTSPEERGESCLRVAREQLDAYFVLLVPELNATPKYTPPTEAGSKWLLQEDEVTAAFLRAAAGGRLGLEHFGGRAVTRAPKLGVNFFAIQAEDDLVAEQAADDMLPYYFTVKSACGRYSIDYSCRAMGRTLGPEGEDAYFFTETPDEPIPEVEASGPTIPMTRQNKGLPIKIFANQAPLGTASTVTKASLTHISH